MYYYSTVDGIVMTHSGIEEKGVIPFVRVHFERLNEAGGFDFADARIPDFIFDKAFGFSEDELFDLTEYMRDNSALIWEFAEKGGAKNA